MKKMKRNLLSLIVFVSFSTIASNNFVNIVKTSSSSYDLVSFKEDITYSEWVFDKEEKCVFDKDESTFYHGVNFNRIETCEETETRTVTTLRTYKDGHTEEESIQEYRMEVKSKPVEVALGTHLEVSCKLILDNGYSTGTKDYYIENAGVPLSVECDMDTDNGGWTKIKDHASSSYSVPAPTVLLDTKLIPHTEMLFSDNNNTTWMDYTGVADTYWRMEGYNLDNNIIMLNNEWYNLGKVYTACAITPKKLPEENFRVLDQSGITNCHVGKITAMETCGRKVAIKIPTGLELEAISDVESAYAGCYTDNVVIRDFKIFIR